MWMIVLSPLRVPEAGVVLDHVVAERDHQVGLLDGPYGVVPGLEADGEEAALVVHVDTALGHEGADHADAGALDELAQLLGRPAADGAVAGEDDRPLGGLDGRPGLVDDLVVGDRPPEAVGGGIGSASTSWSAMSSGSSMRQAPGLLGLGDADGLAHDLGDVVGVADATGPTW